jgi:hypothetical protein
MQFAVNLHTLPENHPWWDEKKRHRRNISRYKSPLMQMLKEYQELIAGKHNAPMECIQAFPYLPSQWRDTIQYTIIQDCEQAKAAVAELKAPMFVDGSARNGLVGIAIAWRRPHAN